MSIKQRLSTKKGQSKLMYNNYTLEEAVIKTVKIYGIEGAELKAKETLNQTPIFKSKFLKTLYKMYNFGNKGA